MGSPWSRSILERLRTRTMTAKLANSLWVSREGSSAPWCTRCASRVHECSMVNTEHHGSSCLVSLRLTREDASLLSRLQKMTDPETLIRALTEEDSSG